MLENLPKIIFVVPAYNEEENIDLFFLKLESKMKELGYPYQVILVNDGSTDSTKIKASKYLSRVPLKIVDHDSNKGVGQVFRTGFKEALKIAEDRDIIITKEADNTGDINILKDMINKINSGYELVLASCYAPGGKIVGAPLDRKILSLGANTIVKILFPIKGINTYSSFYRAYSAKMLRKAFAAYDGRLIDDDGFTFIVGMLIKLSRLRVPISEVPMALYSQERKGKSKMKKLSTILSYFKLIAKELNAGKDAKKILDRYNKI